jgi:hypothetical protein
MEYFTVLTNTGATKIAAAAAANSTIALTQIAVGDGSGTVPVPDISQTALVNEVFRTDLSELTQDEINTNHFIARSVIPEDEGNFWIREIGVYDADGDLIAVGNYPETYKSILTDGAAKSVDLSVVFEVANADVVNLVLDPTIVMASQDYVNQKIANKTDKSYVDEEILKAGSMVLSGVNGLRPDGTVSIVADKVQLDGLAFGVAGFDNKGFKNFSYPLANVDFDGVVPDGDSYIFIEDDGTFGITQNNLVFLIQKIPNDKGNYNLEFKDFINVFIKVVSIILGDTKIKSVNLDNSYLGVFFKLSNTPRYLANKYLRRET